MCKFNHMAVPVNGRHPEFPHLVMAEVEPHYGMLILTIEGMSGTALISVEDWIAMVGDQDQADFEFGYISDEYAELLE